MASYTPLANLRTGRCSNNAEVRLLRFWEAQNIRKGGELMSLDMLLWDEQVTLPLIHQEAKEGEIFDSENMTSNYELFEDTPTNYNDVKRQDAVYHPNFVPDSVKLFVVHM
ncbi:hypothetical protein F2Q68_00009655 [Brassica cretica]|uniref:Uncharacterized protein n=1 Tax=Brassica cretica TaxID=69181 RepID=A0A8S9KQS1_BRACR|nr:hypothetical protein F2Q68_00009655 [Brassica cretica]